MNNIKLLTVVVSCVLATSAGAAEETKEQKQEIKKAVAAEKAEEQQQQLDDVVVTATRTERKTDEVSAGISVVSKESIQNTRMFGIKEALTGLSGVQSETKNGGYDSRLIIRGAGLKAQYGVREIMVLLDGVPITDPDGMSRFDFVDTQMVDRIDVVKGPNSTLYGANAAGGVVNIITKNPFEEIKSLKAGYGSDNMQMYNGILGGKLSDSTYVMLSGSYKSTDGWREWNEFDTSQGGIKVGHLIDAKTSLDFNFQYTEANIQLPGTLTKAAFNADPSQLTSEPWKKSGRYSQIYNTSLKFNKEIGDLTFKPIVYYQNWHHYHPVTGQINDGGAEVVGTDIQVNWKHSLFGAASELTAGIAGQYDASAGSQYAYRDVLKIAGGPQAGRITSTLSDAAGALNSTSNDVISKWGVYAQESIRPSDSWIIDAGVRLDQVLFDLSTINYQSFNYATGKYVAGVNTEGVNKDYIQVSPRIGAVYKINDIYSLYGTVSTGFQTPQGSELETNQNLDPVKTINYETGARARFAGGHTIDLSLFYMDVTDEIVMSYLVGGETTYNNAGSTTKKGLELAYKFQVLQGLFLGGTYTYSDFKYDEFMEPINGRLFNRAGNRLPYIPIHQYSFYAFYKHPSGFKAKLDSYTWGKYQIDNANTSEYSGYYFLTNAMVGYEDSNWDITFDVNNVFDKHYAMEVTKDSVGVDRYRPGAPISFFGKVSYKF